MITNKELNTVKLSPTKKDFYQIWNELLDVSSKISERWDPTSTNESDPGIVLLKVLTAVADKLNYNIDANTLEAFMPSAAQEESMRKLTEMMGYNMKYYRSATTEVKISYSKNAASPIEGTLNIPAFTNIKDIDDSINYITLEEINLNKDTPTKNVTCMEGELVECETDDNNVVSMFHLDDNKRYYLPEIQIAENGIFVSNIVGRIEGERWTKVNNLNSQSMGTKVFKFGFDSLEGLPYIQFPEDISTIIEDGLKIKYVRTSGANGNISVNILSKLEAPASWATIEADNKKDWHDAANFKVNNIRAATNGTNREGLNAAYNNFKKTVGTFNTLVTCRDYMNSIYQMISASDNTTPLVSNIIVSDIRDDINRAVTLGTFTHRGIEYKAIAKKDSSNKDLLTHFDLMFYPFTSTYGLNSKSEFKKSFELDTSNMTEIKTNLEDNKTLAHNFINPEPEELACIKNYYKLRAKVNTVRKVGPIEQANILNNIYTKLFENFNMRQLDFGEEIPYESLLKVMEEADPRIKSVNLDDPELSTVFMTADNTEYSVTSNITEGTANPGNKIYNSLVLNNVLAGRVPLFNYNENFKPEFTEKAYDGSYSSNYPTTNGSTIYKLKTSVDIPVAAVAANSVNEKGEHEILTLKENEVIQFRAPSFKTTLTYPAYVHYYLKLNPTAEYQAAIPVTMQTLGDFLKGGPEATTAQMKEYLEYYINSTNMDTTDTNSAMVRPLVIDTTIRQDAQKFAEAFNNRVSDTKAIFIKKGSAYEWVENAAAGYTLLHGDGGTVTGDINTIFYTFNFNTAANTTNTSAWRNWLINLPAIRYDASDEKVRSKEAESTADIKIEGLYTKANSDFSKPYGRLVDVDHASYKLLAVVKAITANPFDYYYVPRIWSGLKDEPADIATAKASEWHTEDGLGRNHDKVPGLSKGVEYQLKEGEYLLINYSKSAENSDEKIAVNEYYTGPVNNGEEVIKGTIIKPNFDLQDSSYWKQTHSYTKTSGYKFGEIGIGGISQPNGMFTLGTEEQIEIRNIMEAKLDQPVTNIYWKLQEEVAIDGTKINFPFDATGSYTLKEGEYFYYTDMNKTDIAFYGAGTTIKKDTNTRDIYKYTTDEVISVEEISEAGLNASIPWRTYNFSGTNASLTLRENQYINLTKGDSLLAIELAGSADTITNEFTPVVTAQYKLAAKDNSSAAAVSLPKLSLEDTSCSWEVCSRLDLKMSPTKAQTLHKYTVNGYAIIDQLTLINTDYTVPQEPVDSDIITLEATDVNKPLSIKANKVIQSTAVVTDVTTKKVSEDGVAEEIIADLQLKLFAAESITTTAAAGETGSFINLNNFGDGTFTSVNFEEIARQKGSTDAVEFKLNALIPENNFGLIMLYYQNLNKDSNTCAKIITTGKIKKFNTATEEATEIVLAKGINIIQIPASCTLTINSNGNNKASIIFGSLDIIFNENTTAKTTSLNPKLCYKKIDKDTAYEQVLNDIKAIDTNNEFYYNMPIAGNIDIDMNPNDSKDTLENPLNWFNYNNINNKFVIAEIKADDLLDNITIAKSSRSSY